MNSLLMRQRRSAHKRAHKAVVTLNLVSLTDFFTILLEFLHVHRSAPELLERTEGVALPDSISQQLPSQRVVITVNRDVVTVEGNPVVRVADVDGEGVIAPLASVLAAQGARQGPVPEGGRL